MNDRTIYLLAGLIGGAVLPVQVAINTVLKRYVGEPMQVTFVSYLAGTLTSLIFCCFARYSFPAPLHWLKRLGGCGLGAV